MRHIGKICFNDTEGLEISGG